MNKKTANKYNYYLLIQTRTEDEGGKEYWTTTSHIETDKTFNVPETKEGKAFGKELKKVETDPNRRLFKKKHKLVTLLSRENSTEKRTEKNKGESLLKKTERLIFSNGDKVAINFFNNIPFEIGTASDGVVHYSGPFIAEKHNIYLKENLKIGETVNQKLIK